MTLESNINNETFSLAHTVSTESQTFSFHVHEEFEILYFMRGEVRYYVEDESFSLVPGDVLIIPPGRFHRLVTVDESVAYERMVLTLSSDYCKELLKSVPSHFVFTEKRCRRITLGKRDSDFRSMMNMLLALNNSNADMLMRDSVITMLLLQADKQTSFEEKQNEEADKRMTEIIRYINANFTSPITLESIAERFYISKFHLLRTFKSYTRKTVHSYILTKRLLLSKALLKEGISPSDTARECGFSSYAGFYQAFLKEYGVSPNECKKNKD